MDKYMQEGERVGEEGRGMFLVFNPTSPSQR